MAKIYSTLFIRIQYYKLNIYYYVIYRIRGLLEPLFRDKNDIILKKGNHHLQGVNQGWFVSVSNSQRVYSLSLIHI